MAWSDKELTTYTEAQAMEKVNSYNELLMIYYEGKSTSNKKGWVACKAPSSLSWGLMDNSDSDAGRTQDDLMHKNRTSQKRKLELSWNSPVPDVVAELLNLFDPEYIDVIYFDAMEYEAVKKTFYVGDRSAPMAIWNVGNRVFSSLSFNIIER